MDMEQVRKILHTVQLIKLSLLFSIYVKIFLYRVEGVSI